MSVTGLPGQGPVRAGVAISDVTAGLQLAVGILVAIHERARTGRGRYVHTSLLESMIGMLDFQAARWTVARETPPQAGNHHPTLGPMGLYETRDGHINLAAAWGRIWRTFCEVIGRADLEHDARFAEPEDRAENRDALNREITDALQTRTTREWVEMIDGKLKELRLPVNSEAYLERILAAGERVDGSSLFPRIFESSESDIYVVPVYRWAFLNPWEAS